ncbi:nicotinate phosphoribosyltransferase, partial [Singulisphaera rosea]
ASGTSHVEAARRLGIPCVGTMAHSWVQSFETEAEAFTAFAGHFPDATTLLVDTYDVEQGVRHAAAIEPPVQAIRIDSGDLAEEAFRARALLDELRRPQVRIVGSGDLHERSIRSLVERGVPFDAFGVGTELITSRDAPALSLVYKLVELDGKGRLKRSPGKATYPFAKQVFRIREDDGRFLEDRVTQSDESSEGEALLVPMIREGRLVGTYPRLEEIRAHCRVQLESLPETLRDLDETPTYPVVVSARLQAAAEELGHRS